MSLIKEDGTGVAGANTYASDADLTTYATARGITVPATSAEREALLLKAMDYIESLDYKFLGNRVTGIAQSLLWPRDNVYFYGDIFSKTAIPAELVKAQIVLAIAAQTIDFFPIVTADQRNVKRKTVGPITIEYSSTAAQQNTSPYIPQAHAYLRFLFGNNGQPLVVRG